MLDFQLIRFACRSINSGLISPLLLLDCFFRISQLNTIPHSPFYPHSPLYLHPIHHPGCGRRSTAAEHLLHQSILVLILPHAPGCRLGIESPAQIRGSVCCWFGAFLIKQAHNCRSLSTVQVPVLFQPKTIANTPTDWLAAAQTSLRCQISLAGALSVLAAVRPTDRPTRPTRPTRLEQLDAATLRDFTHLTCPAIGLLARTPPRPSFG